MKALGYSPVVLFNMLYTVVITFESVDKVVICDHSNDTLISIKQHFHFPAVPFVFHYITKYKAIFRVVNFCVCKSEIIYFFSHHFRPKSPYSRERAKRRTNLWIN